MIKSSTDNYRKISTECLAISICLYIAIAFHNSLTEKRKLRTTELILSVQSLNILHLNYSTKLCLISWPHVWMLQTFHVRFPILVNDAKCNPFVVNVESQ